MKYIVYVMLGFVMGVGSCKERKDDSVSEAKQENKGKPVDKDISDFLIKITDARLMDAAEGDLAANKAGNEELRGYGRMMRLDQSKLLEKINALASERNISLPSAISAEKQSGYNELASKTGKEFDKTFIKMMRIDHERDISDFKKAQDLKDSAVVAFATDNLPMIEYHLSTLIELRDSVVKR